MLIDLDFDGVEAAKPFEALPDGIYTLVISDAKIEDSKNSTAEKPVAPNFKLTFNVVGSDNNRIWHQFNLNEKSRPYLKQFLVSIFGDSVPRITMNTEEDRQEFCAALIGMDCEAIVERVKRKDVEPPTVKFTNTVSAFNPR